jgi:hypothetical protein
VIENTLTHRIFVLDAAITAGETHHQEEHTASSHYSIITGGEHPALPPGAIVCAGPMEKAAAQASGEVCHRCLQPIAPSAQRCPNCGERHSPRNRLPIFIGILGLLALVFVAIIMVQVIRNNDADSAPPDQPDEQSSPQTPDRPPPLNP